jgi:hypothetical protein
MLAFEVTSGWITFGPLYRILRSVEGVAGVRRNWLNDDRVSFIYLGQPFVVHEPRGDSSRYWIGPADTDALPLDLTPLRAAFEQHRNPIARAWAKLASRNT